MDLVATDLVGHFKQLCRTLNFIPPSDYPHIDSRLDILVDIKHRTGRTKKYYRYAKTQAAKWLWEYFLQLSLKEITVNMRGYTELVEYYRQYIHYENLLFDLDEHHRDHVIHTIWVMIIGFVLLKSYRPCKTLSYFGTSWLGDKTPPMVYRTISKVHLRQTPLWFLVALTHDLGYPIQKTLYANEAMSQMIRNFGFLNFTEFTYNFTIVHKTAIDELLNILSAALVWINDEEYKLGFHSGQRLDFSKSFERLDHGIMSAYLILQYMDHICETIDVCNGVPEHSCKDVDLAATQVLIITWLYAIASHTNRNIYFPTFRNIPALLFIADELDEFSRYSHKTTTDQWAPVECNVDFTCSNQSINFTYTFLKKSDFDSLSLFKRKIEKIMNRFELRPSGINKISIKLKDYRQRPSSLYHYERSPLSGPLGTVRKSHGHTTQDILGFLRGTLEL